MCSCGQSAPCRGQTLEGGNWRTRCGSLKASAPVSTSVAECRSGVRQNRTFFSGFPASPSPSLTVSARQEHASAQPSEAPTPSSYVVCILISGGLQSFLACHTASPAPGRHSGTLVSLPTGICEYMPDAPFWQVRRASFAPAGMLPLTEQLHTPH